MLRNVATVLLTRTVRTGGVRSTLHTTSMMASYKVQHSPEDQEFFINFEEKEGIKAYLKYEKYGPKTYFRKCCFIKH